MKNTLRLSLAVLCLCASMICAHEKKLVCGTEGCGLADSNERFQALCPIPNGTTNMIPPAKRLDTLDGKTIAVVGGSFMAAVTHPEIKRLILQHYPKARVILLNEIGSAGPWPGPGVIRAQKDEFMEKLRQMHVDAVIAGNGGCGLCTPKEMGSCIAAEYSGIPSVMIAAPGFTEQAKFTAHAAGVSVARVAEYPGVFTSHTSEELLHHTRVTLWPQIVKALTNPVDKREVEQNTNPIHPDQPIYTGTLHQVNNYFAQQGWTDGLPVIPPTIELVANFLKFCDDSAQSVVAVVPPSRRAVTVRHVAINGAMAGCPPEFMPILIAITKAMSHGDFRHTLSSTHAWTPYCWVNGPIARQLGLQHGQGEISAQRNAVLGRFFNLAMLNFGGYYIQKNRMGTFGYLMPWCMAEDESASLKLGWLPYHMQQGYQVNENTLTAASALNWGNNLAPAASDADTIMQLMAWDATEKQQFAIGSGTPCVFRTFLITESVARDLSKKYKSKEELETALVNTARIPVQQRAMANYYANPGSSFNPNSYPLERHVAKVARTEQAASTPIPMWLTWCNTETLSTVPAMQKGKSAFLVTGDANRNKTMCVPGGFFTTIKITLPKKWDALMAESGYPPIQSYYLETQLKPNQKKIEGRLRLQKKTGMERLNPRHL